MLGLFCILRHAAGFKENFMLICNGNNRLNINQKNELSSISIYLKEADMYKLKVITSFAAAHNLINYQGDCENLHGHNWRVEIIVTAKELDTAGLGIDFKILKSEANFILKKLDHKYLNELSPFIEVSPSSENIACYLFQELSSKFNNNNVKVSEVTVWESDFASASYYE